MWVKYQGQCDQEVARCRCVVFRYGRTGSNVFDLEEISVVFSEIKGLGKRKGGGWGYDIHFTSLRKAWHRDKAAIDGNITIP